MWSCSVLTLKYIRLYLTENTSDSFKSNRITKTHNLRAHNASCYHSNENMLTVSPDYSCFLLITFLMSYACWTGQRYADGKAEQLAGPVQRCHRHAREHPVHDRGTAYAGLHNTAALSLPVTTQRGMMGGMRVQIKMCSRAAALENIFYFTHTVW